MIDMDTILDTGAIPNTLRDPRVRDSYLGYEADGHIITPVDAPYNPHSDALPLHKRSLTVVPDVCKVKRWADLTIDFTTVKPSTHVEQDKVVLIPGQLLSNGKGSLDPFEGSMINTFDVNTQVDWASALLENVSDSTIIEYKPTHRILLDPKTNLPTKSDIILTPIIVRNEKPFPNSLEFAKDIWDTINHPIRPETLHGEGIDLMRYYHNNNKRDMWNSIPENAMFIDIGSGNGGDAAKWRRLGRGLALEPDDTHLIELQRRIDLYSKPFDGPQKKGGKIPIPLNQRVKVVKAYGQDAETIITAAEDWLWPHMTSDDQPLVITSMLTLSFFDNDGIIALARTIKGLVYSYHESGGTGTILFKFFTIAGDAVKELIADRLGDTLQYGVSSIKLAKVIEIIPQTPESIYINITGTIVEHQLEYLVNISNLLSLLGSTEIVANRADAEVFLNADERTFSQLFIYGTANVIAEEKYRLYKWLMTLIPKVY